MRRRLVLPVGLCVLHLVSLKCSWEFANVVMGKLKCIVGSLRRSRWKIKCKIRTSRRWKLKGIPQLTVLVIIITFSIHIYKLLITFGLVLHFREQLKNTMPLFIIMEIVIWIHISQSGGGRILWKWMQQMKNNAVAGVQFLKFSWSHTPTGNNASVLTQRA